MNLKLYRGEIVRFVSLVLLLVLAVGVAGCAKKTASEQLQADMKKAADKMKKDINSL